MHLSQLLNTNSLKLNRTGQQSLRPGQIVQGEVVKLYPENKAEIKLGGNRFIASLQVGLELGGSYHFQVASTANSLQLRVLGEKLKKDENVDLSKLLRQLGVKSSKHNLQLLQLLTRYSVPFDKNELKQALQLLKGEQNKRLAAGTLVEMLAKKLPMTEMVLQSLITVRTTTLSEQLTSVIQQLINSTQLQSEAPNLTLRNGTDTEQRLRQIITTLIPNKQAADIESFQSFPSKQMFLEQLRQSLAMLGLNYENRLATEKEPENLSDTIKGLLLQLASGENSTEVKQQTRLLHLIQGLQLQSVNETPSFIQAMLQIPAERLGLVKDLVIEFEGKKNEDGEVNPDYCRILFYLELKNLKETVIDVNIQQRAVSLTVFNNTAGIPILANTFKDKLSENLTNLNYRLTSIVFKKLEKKDNRSVISDEKLRDNKQGVDFLI
ncbi:hypothetical protein [Oceanobacillus alkalisoli]|uniref:hypothetical protein n=1 Tax=Oceanobacillus alkalisoli TaxID=2925113 RepID=UPI001EE3B1F2|nr:hypothetical protein [Oceanobacillus alkalisoli]MCG5103506.1 hypothetical protein [Oceanobacillus alkalisoli]